MPYKIYGPHLGVVRRWMQRKAVNGEMVTWGSDTPLHFHGPITPAMMDQLAQDIADSLISTPAHLLTDAEFRALTRLADRLDRVGPTILSNPTLDEAIEACRSIRNRRDHHEGKET